MKMYTLLGAIFALFLFGCSPTSNNQNGATENNGAQQSANQATTNDASSPDGKDKVHGQQTQAPNPITSLAKEYPTEVVAAGIPNYENATIQRVNQYTNENAPKYQMTLWTNETPEAINTFYTEKMTTDGWKLVNSTAPSGENKRQAMIFTKDKLQTVINSFEHPKGDKNVLSILFMEKK